MVHNGAEVHGTLFWNVSFVKDHYHFLLVPFKTSISLLYSRVVSLTTLDLRAKYLPIFDMFPDIPERTVQPKLRPVPDRALLLTNYQTTLVFWLDFGQWLGSRFVTTFFFVPLHALIITPWFWHSCQILQITASASGSCCPGKSPFFKELNHLVSGSVLFSQGKHTFLLYSKWQFLCPFMHNSLSPCLWYTQSFYKRPFEMRQRPKNEEKSDLFRSLQLKYLLSNNFIT